MIKSLMHLLHLQGESMIAVEQYLKLGFRGLVILDTKIWTENSNGRHTMQSVACHDNDGAPLSFTVHWVENPQKNGAVLAHTIEAKEAISQQQYESLVMTYGVQDGPLYYQDRAKREKIKRDAIRALQKMTPFCPVCKNRMVLRTRTQEGFLWECSVKSQDTCAGTCPISADDFQKYEELKKLAELP